MRDVLRVITRLTSAGAAMPNNPELGAQAGGRGRSSALRALRRLVRAGKLAVETKGTQRRVTVLATGLSTAWGEARPGHSPFIRRDQGLPPSNRKKARAPNTMPLAAQLPPNVTRGPPVFIEAVDTCQWPMWEDGARPGSTALFCGGEAYDATSFCEEHVTLAYPCRKKSIQPRNSGVGKSVAILRDPRFAAAIVGFTDLT